MDEESDAKAVKLSLRSFKEEDESSADSLESDFNRTHFSPEIRKSFEPKKEEVLREEERVVNATEQSDGNIRLDDEEVIWTDRDRTSLLYLNVLAGLGLIGVICISLILNIPDIPTAWKIVLLFVSFGYIIFTEYLYIIIHKNPIKVCQSGIIIPKYLLAPCSTEFLRWEDIRSFRFSFTLEPNLNIIKLYVKDKRPIRRRIMDIKGVRESLQVIGKVKEEKGLFKRKAGSNKQTK